MIANVLTPTIPKSFQRRLRDFDDNLRAVFNCHRERFEIHRYSRGYWHWIIAVENEDGSFRPLDDRVFKKLYEMDIIERYGSVEAFEKNLEERQKRWQVDKQREIDHELKCDIRDDRKLWQTAAENFRSGKINEPPEQNDKKIISYQKGEVR